MTTAEGLMHAAWIFFVALFLVFRGRSARPDVSESASKGYHVASVASFCLFVLALCESIAMRCVQ